VGTTHIIDKAQWPTIVEQVLAGSRDARALLRMQVEFYVECIFRPTLVRLAGDPTAVHALARQVIAQLEHADDAMLRAWLDRHQCGRDVSGWWKLVQAVARRCALDHARLHGVTPPAAADAGDEATIYNLLRQRQQRTRARRDVASLDSGFAQGTSPYLPPSWLKMQ
jgi:hypothetical protein